MWCVVILHREEAMHMLLEQAMLQFIIFIFIELVIITAVAAILFITLVVVIRKSDKKNASLPDR